MDTISKTLNSSGRFRSLLSGNCQMVEIWDTVVYEDANFLVVPTLGSIVPNWLLIIPKKTCTCFADLELMGFPKLRDSIYATADNLRLSAEQILWFEHGAKQTGSDTGCGVDYAHAHVIINPTFSFGSFKNSVFDALPIDWASYSVTNSLPVVSNFENYLVFGFKDEAFFTNDVSKAGSQFFRRVIARLVGLDEQWDYTQHPHIENVKLTLRKFGKY